MPADLLGFHVTLNLGKYLGFPLKHPSSCRQDFGFVLDRVKKKLARWKTNLLSMAGRIVLIQSSHPLSQHMSCKMCPCLTRFLKG